VNKLSGWTSEQIVGLTLARGLGRGRANVLASPRRCDAVCVSAWRLLNYQLPGTRFIATEEQVNKLSGYPERFAQEALGHNSKAVHRAYARKAIVELPPLSEFERRRAVFAEGQSPEPIAQVVNA
jgi:hypothetical protein